MSELAVKEPKSFRAIIEADLVLVERDLMLLKQRLNTLSDTFYAGHGPLTVEKRDKVNKEWKFFKDKEQELLQEQKRLKVQLVQFQENV